MYQSTMFRAKSLIFATFSLLSLIVTVEFAAASIPRDRNPPPSHPAKEQDDSKVRTIREALSAALGQDGDTNSTMTNTTTTTNNGTNTVDDTKVGPNANLNNSGNSSTPTETSPPKDQRTPTSPTTSPSKDQTTPTSPTTPTNPSQDDRSREGCNCGGTNPDNSSPNVKGNNNGNSGLAILAILLVVSVIINVYVLYPKMKDKGCAPRYGGAKTPNPNQNENQTNVNQEPQANADPAPNNVDEKAKEVPTTGRDSEKTALAETQNDD